MSHAANNIENSSAAQERCPIDHSQFASYQKTGVYNPRGLPRVEETSQGVWIIRGFTEARAILRGKTRQAGFRVELLADRPQFTNPPNLFMDGDEHRLQRKQTAKFFTPNSTQSYRQLMIDFADGVVNKLRQDGVADLSDLSMELAVLVAAQIIGLPNTRIPGMARRITRLIETNIGEFGWSLRQLTQFASTNIDLLNFYQRDVKPAIDARRKEPSEDLISHLISQGYSSMEILTECVMYGAAGMATTREFICVAFLHLMENPTIRRQYLSSDEAARYRILHELLRLEPVVANLLRRTEEDFRFEQQENTVTVPTGALVSIDLYAVNADPRAVGNLPFMVDIDRDLAERVQEPVMSFGDGHHRCPGAFVAIQESDIFLQRLLQVEGLRIERLPDITRNELIKSYEIRNLLIAVG